MKSTQFLCLFHEMKKINASAVWGPPEAWGPRAHWAHWIRRHWVGHCKYSCMLYHFQVIWRWIIVRDLEKVTECDSGDANEVKNLLLWMLRITITRNFKRNLYYKWLKWNVRINIKNYGYNVSTDNNTIYIYKIGPNTHRVVLTPTTTTEKDLKH